MDRETQDIREIIEEHRYANAQKQMLTNTMIDDVARRMVAGMDDLSEYEFRIHPSVGGADPPATVLSIPLIVDADCPLERVFLVRRSATD